jgi:hypothetical protein
MTGMWATPVVQINFQEFSIEGLERARNSPFPGGLLTETLPQLQTFNPKIGIGAVSVADRSPATPPGMRVRTGRLK